MKIGILTQPIGNNYGGLIQAYALQKVLMGMGHEVWIINRVAGKRSLYRRLFIILKQIIKCLLYQKKQKLSWRWKKKKVGLESTYFVNKYINNVTNEIYTTRELIRSTKGKFDAIIVGSDQVWRLSYSPNILNYYLDFTKKFIDIKRIAYAASFGLDFWHYSKSITKRCKKLINKFDAVSVREDTAATLCKKYFNVEAEQLVDPSMLLERNDYLKIIHNEDMDEFHGGLYVYFLDESKEKIALIDKFAKELHMSVYKYSKGGSDKAFIKSLKEQFTDHSLAGWLNGFANAKFVITDSFHGCVFSIIFNKPFLALGNVKRGLCRFTSLLTRFNLSDRLLLEFENINPIDYLNVIDWEQINLKIEIERNASIRFLKTALK